MIGRWQVGNAHLTAGKGKMAQANQLTNQLLDDLFDKELKPEYEGFKSLAQEYDAINIEDQDMSIILKSTPSIMESICYSKKSLNLV